MKKVSYLFLLFSIILGTASCTHKSESYTAAGDYLIIGNVGGFVSRSTTNYYRITNSQFAEDTTIPYGYPPTSITQFNFNTVLPVAKYDAVKGLLTSIPSELLSKNNMHIGAIYPDMGYTDVWASINGATYRWYFEGDQSASSTAVQQFVNSLQVVFQ